MNTLWLKIASAAIGILILIVLVSMFIPSGSKEPVQQPAEPNLPTTFYDQAKKDREDFTVPPEQTNPENQNVVSSLQSPAQSPNETGITTQPFIEVKPVPEQPTSNEVTIYVKPVSEMEKVEADREINYAVPMLSIGRLPATSYKPMIESIRRILNRWPDSIYAYQAKRMLAKVPERFQDQYHITPEELDISMFSKPRAGTVPMKIKVEE